MMKGPKSTFLALLGLAPVVHSVPTSSTPVASVDGSQGTLCGILGRLYPNNIFLPGSAAYTYETQTEYWSATLYEGPACVFVPQNAQQVSSAVVTATLTLTKFAVRGGGHMPIPGANSIDSSGFLISTSNLTTLALSSDNSTVSVGPGNRWINVYDYLEPFGLCAVGGRIGDVGVPGYILGGGISFYSSEYGFGADNVVQFQVVLASGSIVQATATNEYADLFWALKGGANSFGIVTEFILKTIDSPQVWVGIAEYDESQSAGYLDAVYNFGEYGSLDSKAAIIPTVITFPSENITAYAAAKFYDSAISSSTVFENFTAPILTPEIDTFALQPLGTYIAGADALQPNGLRQDFRAFSSIVNRGAVQIIHDTFISEVSSELGNITGLQASVTFQPVPESFIQHGIDNGGNPQGLDPSGAPYFWMVENWTWSSEDDDDTITAAADAITASITSQLAALCYGVDYIYLNDAGKGQQVFQNYPAANLEKLQSIRTKYDPLRVYTNLLVGGWKVLSA
ncbi:FAD binding domain-containing protein [Xylariales sp. PMI_506]|nr:FAD binding domain-containing protein [Xylariales sp. PMI_506]